MTQKDQPLSEEKLEVIRCLIDDAQKKLEEVKLIVFGEVIKTKAGELKSKKTDKIIEGIFDGENMITDDDQHYPVPANYASKSKLVPGDVLKLTIADDGTFIFKQIAPVPRKRITGTLNEIGEEFTVDSEGKKYRVLLASVTYHKAATGDQLAIIVPEQGEAGWAAIDNVIKQTA